MSNCGADPGKGMTLLFVGTVSMVMLAWTHVSGAIVSMEMGTVRMKISTVSGMAMEV